MKEVKVVMYYRKSTKRTHVYSCEDAAVTQLYIQRDAFDGNPPLEIVITVKESS